jgi:hypothetical protein
MSSLARKAASAGLLAVLGCVAASPLSNPWSHPPTAVAGLPDRFVPDSSFTLVAASDTACLVHLIDPETQTRLLLERSTYPSHVTDSTVRSTLGDYKVEPQDRFGVNQDELLRLVCATGQPLGKVPE